MVTLKRVVTQVEKVPRWAGELSRDEYVTNEEAAWLLGVKKESVRSLVEDGRLEALVVHGERAIPILSVARLKKAGYTGKRTGRLQADHCKRGHSSAENRMPSGGCKVCARLTLRARRGVKTHQRVWP